MLSIARFHSADVVNGEIVFRLIGTDNKLYQMSVPTQAAAMMAMALQAESNRLAENIGPALIPSGIQPVIGPDLEPGIVIELGGNLSIIASLPGPQLQALKDAIQQLERNSKPQSTKH